MRLEKVLKYRIRRQQLKQVYLSVTEIFILLPHRDYYCLTSIL
jgi:hypothetical protein